MTRDHRKVQNRNESFDRRPKTIIWQELPCEENPYLASSCRCFGYDLLELMEKRGFVDVLYLLFRGELPTTEQASLLEHLMIALINPGPRHPATRAAMLAGVSKSDPTHILPIALTILSGTHLGAGEIEAAMLFLQKQAHTTPEHVAFAQVSQGERPAEGDWSLVPGFGSRFNGIDVMSEHIASRLKLHPAAGQKLSWGSAFAEALKPHRLGWLPTGLAAAVFSDLGFLPRAGAGLYQILCAPGLLAHGVEFANKPMTAMPFPKDEDYFIEND